MRTVFLSTPLLTLLAAALVVGCHAGKPVEATDQDVVHSETLRPADAKLSAIYERSCVTCHGTRSAAPLTGFAPAWAPRLEQGMDVLLSHAREGFKGMPAKGLCSDCSDEELRGLIEFMSQAK